MNNYRLTIQYDGRRYNGWQKQGNTTNTIQGILEELISTYLSENCGCAQKIELHGSGRTDAGVHAKEQVASFKTSCSLNPADMLLYLNSHLFDDIRIIHTALADDNFHARRSAIGKFYLYYIDNRAIPDVFRRNYSLHIKDPLDINEMKKAAVLLLGEHDFSSFCTKSNANIKKSSIRIIYDIEITSHNGLIQIRYHGNGFLYNMVRILTGTLIEIGLGTRPADDISALLQKKDRASAGPTVPSNALFLEKVEYQH